MNDDTGPERPLTEVAEREGLLCLGAFHVVKFGDESTYPEKSLTYLASLKKALDRTNGYGVATPAFVPTSARYLSEASNAEIANAVLSELDCLSIKDLYGQCLAIHCRVRPIIEKVLGTSVLLTIGYVNLKGKDYFRNSEEELRGLMQTGITGKNVSLHAWLTLPSLEILDFALPTSLAVHNGWKTGRGDVVSEHADELEGMTYHPQLVGELVLEKMGAMRFERS